MYLRDFVFAFDNFFLWENISGGFIFLFLWSCEFYENKVITIKKWLDTVIEFLCPRPERSAGGI